MELENLIRTKVRGIKPMRSLDYRSGSVRLNDFDNKIKVSLIKLPIKKHEDPDNFLEHQPLYTIEQFSD